MSKTPPPEHPWLFHENDYVVHVKTAGTYFVLLCGYQEGDHTPVYAYRKIKREEPTKWYFVGGGETEPLETWDLDGPIWVRPASEFEDGRFRPLVTK
jgi:hypothetical protein